MRSRSRPFAIFPSGSVFVLGLALAAAILWPAGGVPGAETGPIDISGGCSSRECHGGMLDRPTVHTAVQLEQCEACHAPVADAHSFEPVPDPPGLCLECHESMTDGRYVHDIVEMGECLACHDPHGSAVPELLVEDSVAATCAGCHDDPAAGLASPHGPARDGDCLVCHRPHHAKHAKLVDRLDGDLCLSCHDRVVRRPDGSTVRNIGSVIKRSAHVHAPASLDECLVCHGAHGGASSPALSQQFPPGLYARFSAGAYLLCFQCHDEALAMDEHTTETGFRDGTRNLHFVHVNKEAKGRSCQACHDPHATNLPHLLRGSVPFGAWQFSLRFTDLPTGGGCWPGCHQKITYDRNATP